MKFAPIPKKCAAGRNNSERILNVKTPPMKRNDIDVMIYKSPISV
ncbi:MAG: hypothetical protein WBF33_21660 [Candidatus Nitrosopolaris sp.]